MKLKIVKLQIVDYDANGEILFEYDLINPDRHKLAELKQMIENRHDYGGLTDKEIEAKEELCDFIWDKVNDFIAENFIVLNIGETYEIAY